MVRRSLQISLSCNSICRVWTGPCIGAHPKSAQRQLEGSPLLSWSLLRQRCPHQTLQNKLMTHARVSPNVGSFNSSGGILKALVPWQQYQTQHSVGAHSIVLSTMPPHRPRHGMWLLHRVPITASCMDGLESSQTRFPGLTVSRQARGVMKVRLQTCRARVAEAGWGKRAEHLAEPGNVRHT